MIRRYHDGTKHSFDRFARSLGYLDWANQPDPFRSFDGAPSFLLPPNPSAPLPASPIGVVLRHALGLTAWKAFGTSRWSLRANPSSGNLHPTEAYVVCSATEGLGGTAAVYHYAADRHLLEQRCAFASDVLPRDVILIPLTSIHWREAWKYGERAFRYCQHDMGHAIAALSFAASLVGWRVELRSDWSYQEVAAISGIDRDDDYVDAEREEPGALLVVTQGSDGRAFADLEREQLVADVRRGVWTGRASQLSEDHVQWTFIDEVAAATRIPVAVPPAMARPPTLCAAPAYPAHLLVRRRSALAFDGRSSVSAAAFEAMLRRTLPDGPAIWNGLWWSARIHLALFVHRVDDVDPGLYLLLRESSSGDRLIAALGRRFLMEPVGGDGLPLLKLATGDSRALARRLSCDQDIAADGFFSLGMIADFDVSLSEYGDAFYRHLFWESGVVGQTLYLEAEALGARATGIGCFYDDPVHAVLGLEGHAFQSLYHFSVGMPIEDERLVASAGYAWERPADRPQDASANPPS